MNETNTDTKPTVELLGHDGNAFAIMACCNRAWREHYGTGDGWEEVQNEMVAGDYDHLLQTVLKYFDVE
jgi:hypothetical protein